MSRVEEAREHCAALRRLWLEATESEREQISSEICALTQRPAFDSLSDRVLAEMRGSDG